MASLVKPTQMLRAMNEMPGALTFLKDRLVSGGPQISDKKYIELDKYVAKQGVAVYNSRTGAPNEVGKKGYTTDLHVSPYVNEVITMTPSDFDVREPGENAYQTNLASNLGIRTVKYLRELNMRLDRLEEKQIAEAITLGTVTVSGGGDDYTVDYGLDDDNKETLLTTARWGESADDIKGNIVDWAQRLTNKGYVATDLVMDKEASEKFIADTDILALLDNRRVQMGEIAPRRIANQNASYLGTFSSVGVNIDCWAYVGTYETADDTFSPYLDTNRAVLIGSGLELEQHYGKIENFKAGFRGARFPNMWEELNGKVRYIGMESSPLAVLRNPNCIFSAKVYS